MPAATTDPDQGPSNGTTDGGGVRPSRRSAALTCPHCGAVDDSEVMRSFGNAWRAALNSLFILVLLDIAILFALFHRLPMRLVRRCCRCRGTFSARTPVVNEPRCGGCGYDLTGNRSGVCPECGWKLPARVRRLVHARERLIARDEPGDRVP